MMLKNVQNRIEKLFRRNKKSYSELLAEIEYWKGIHEIDTMTITKLLATDYIPKARS